MAGVLPAAAWLGLCTGLVEGSLFLLFQRLGWLSWNMSQIVLAPEILWVAPLLDLGLFTAAGLAGVVALTLPLPIRLSRRAVLGLLAFPMFFSWLALSGRLRLSAAAILALGLATVVARWLAKREDAALRFFRRTLPALAGLCLLLFLAIEGGQRFAEHRALARLPQARAAAPNVLVIVVDTLRADHLSTYGYARPTSPHIDQLAGQSVLFETAISTTSWTLPAHISILTGRNLYQFQDTPGRLDPALPNLADALRADGYRTGAFSANLFYFTRQQGFGRGFIRFEDLFQSWEDSFARTLFGRKFVEQVLPRFGYEDLVGRKSAEEVTDRALRWIRSDSHPFFAFLNYFDVHDPYLPPQPYRGRFSSQPAPGGKVHADTSRLLSQLTPEELQGEIDAYDGAIAYVDENIGRLLQSLEEAGLAKNTLVVLLSDHGEMFGEQQLLLHGNCLYRPVLQVPLIVRWPGKIPAGLRVSQPVSIASLPATVAELTGSKPAFPGPSLANLWQNFSPSQGDGPLPLAEMDVTPFEPMSHEPSYHGPLKSLVTPDWHYIERTEVDRERLQPTGKRDIELFPWADGPLQQHNRALDPANQNVVADFRARLNALTGPQGNQSRQPGQR